MICISIGKAELIDSVNRMKPALVELRFDLMDVSPGEVIPLIDKGTGIIATCRRAGLKPDPAMVLGNAIDLGVEYVDLEIEMIHTDLNDLAAAARKNGTSVIVSWHDFERTPDSGKLRKVLTDCYKKGADVAKIATMTHHPADAARLMGLYALKGRKVVLGMGEAGRITRLAAGALGAEFTFAAAGAGEITAPGQPTFDELLMFNKILDQK